MIQLSDKKDCCGCGACIQSCPKNCISLDEDSEGFLYPKVNIRQCVDCGMCNRVCPVICQGGQHKPLQVFAAKNPNEEIRRQSSSGGIFTLLAEKILEEGGVVFGACFNSNWEVVHDYTETLSGVARFRGSKYVQSRIGDSYQKTESFLQEGRKVLFSGTPCQIAGLRLYLRKEYENLLTVDFICHGVPSPGVWREYLKNIAARRAAAGKNTVLSSSLDNQDDLSGRITSISFRDKVLGWKKFSFVVRGSATDGAEKNSVLLSEDLHTNIFLKGFLADLYLRPSCYACPAKSGKSGSDITIGDFWGIEYVLPKMDDDKGISAVLINTQKGAHFYNSIDCIDELVSYWEVAKGNGALQKNCIKPKLQETFYQLYGKEDLCDLILRLTRLPLKKKMRKWLRILLDRMGILIIIKKYADRNSYSNR